MRRLFAIAIPLLVLWGCGTENNPTFKLTTTVSPAGAGTILPTQTAFDKGEIAVLEAVPTNGWKFIRWEGDLTSTVNPVNLGMTKDYNIIGIFERRDYPLTVTVEGQGSVTERVVIAKSTDYPFETIVELTPIAAEGWVFKEWGGDLSGSQSPSRITVTGAKSVTAKFERRNYALTVTVEGQGSVTEAVVPQKSTDYPFQTVVQLTPVPSDGWIFVEWSGDLTGSDAPKSITVDKPKSVVAKFERRNYALTVTVEGQGSVTERVVLAKSTDYPFETIVELTPIASLGWAFKEWDGDLSGSQSPTRVTISEPKSVVARFMTSPTVTTGTISNLSASQATIAGTVTSDGGNAVTARGICYATTQNPTTAGSCVDSGTGTGTFSATVTGLSQGRTYYVRAYATNNIGTSYGAQVSFTTWTTPSVASTGVSSIVVAGAVINGNVTSDGGTPITARGICYSTAQNPTMDGTCVDSGTGTGTFSASLTGLSHGTTYYVRAYASNSVGTSYSSQSSFTTWTFPSVTTGTIANIASYGGTLGGNVTASGGTPVTARGICYSTSENPTIAGTCMTSGSGNGQFLVRLSGLTAETTYFARAFATNGVGTSYGNQVSYSTISTVSDIDGNMYPTVQIGTQMWMAENLRTSRYRTGVKIPHVTDSATWSDLTSGSWSYYGNNATNEMVHGKLYNWFSVQEGLICPIDWRVPLDSDLDVLATFLGVDAGKQMKSTSLWSGGGNGNGLSGFDAKPSGFRHGGDGSFGGLGAETHFWTQNSEAWNYELRSQSNLFSKGAAIKDFGFSIRCIKN